MFPPPLIKCSALAPQDIYLAPACCKQKAFGICNLKYFWCNGIVCAHCMTINKEFWKRLVKSSFLFQS